VRCNCLAEVWRELLGETRAQRGVMGGGREVLKHVGGHGGEKVSAVLSSPAGPQRVSAFLNHHRLWRSEWRAALSLGRRSTDARYVIRNSYVRLSGSYRLSCFPPM